MGSYRIGSLTCELDALDRKKILSLLVKRIAKLPERPKKLLALYYHENLPLAEIATALGLTEYEIDQMRAKTLDVLQMMLAMKLGAAERVPVKKSGRIVAKE
jgi:RNA polymerase sigma factor (sigma-70 family)